MPKPIQRRLFQISAILEMADDQFKYVRRKVGALRDEYKTEISAGRVNVPVNVDSVDVFLAQSSVFEELREKLDAVGLNLSPQSPNAGNPLSKLNQTLFHARVLDVAAFERIVSTRTTKQWLSELEKVAKIWRSLGKTGPSGAPVGPPKLVLDYATIARIMVIRETSSTKVRQILRDVPFGERLQKSVTRWRDEAGPY